MICCKEPYGNTSEMKFYEGAQPKKEAVEKKKFNCVDQFSIHCLFFSW